MGERVVIRIVDEHLRAKQVVNLKVHYGQEHGPDMETQLLNSRLLLFIEAKGNVKAPDSAIGAALYQILTRYEGQAICRIALLFTERYEKLTRNILPGIRRPRLDLFSVKEPELWHLLPNAGGFFISKPGSLVEALEL